MQVETIDNTKTLLISDAIGIDPITVILQDISAGKGRLIVECWGEAWSILWTGMSAGLDIREFILKCDDGYITQKLMRPKASKKDVDYLHKIVLAIKEALKENDDLFKKTECFNIAERMYNAYGVSKLWIRDSGGAMEHWLDKTPEACQKAWEAVAQESIKFKNEEVRKETELFKLAEEGAKEAFGVIVTEKEGLKKEVARIQDLLTGAYALIKKMSDENKGIDLNNARMLRDQVLKTWSPPLKYGNETPAQIAQTAVMQTLAYVLGVEFLPEALTVAQHAAIHDGIKTLDHFCRTLECQL